MRKKIVIHLINNAEFHTEKSGYTEFSWGVGATGVFSNLSPDIKSDKTTTVRIPWHSISYVEEIIV